MFEYLKILPVILLAAALAYSGHIFVVRGLETQINQLQTDVTRYQTQNTALQTAADINEQTIHSLEDHNKDQIEQAAKLTNIAQQLQKEKDEYLSIFSRHDLQRLALAKPGLVEPKLNNGTKNVFKQIEEDSKEESKGESKGE